MNRHTRAAATIAALALSVAGLRGDVKTRERTQVTLSGMMGAMLGHLGGQSKDGVVSVVSVKGTRMSSMNETTGQIIDLTEQKVYDLDIKKKQYTVTTFEELRKRMEDAIAKAKEQAKNAKPEDKAEMQQAANEIEIEFDVKETGQKKPLAGYDTHEVIMTITTHIKGQKIEESGGTVMTSDMWIASKVPALSEIGEFRLKYAQALMGDTGMADMQQMAALMAAYPSFVKMSEKMRTEGAKLAGTALSTTTTFDNVKSAEAMKAAASPPPSSGGGIGGMIGRKIMARGPAQAKSTVFSTLTEYLSIDAAASADDVAMPAGFKEKK